MSQNAENPSSVNHVTFDGFRFGATAAPPGDPAEAIDGMVFADEMIAWLKANPDLTYHCVSFRPPWWRRFWNWLRRSDGGLLGDLATAPMRSNGHFPLTEERFRG